MQKLFAKFSQDSFLRHSFIFFVGSIFVAVLNYLYHPVLSRMMSVEDFGELQALFSIFAQVGVLVSVFGLVALNIFINKREDNQNHFSNLYSFFFYIMLALCAILVMITPIINSALQIETTFGLPLIALALLVAIPMSAGRSILQSEHRFGVSSIAQAISAGGKLLIAALFVYIGLAVFGAVAGLLIASIFSLLYVYIKTCSRVGLPRFQTVSFSPFLQRELKYGGFILVAMGFITFIYTGDVLLAKYYFSPEQAGLYSGIATVARIIFFGTAAIATVLLSHLKIENSKAENNKILLKALTLVGTLGLVGFAGMYVMPELITRLLIGEKFLPLANLLPLLALHTFVVSLLNVFIAYVIALRKYLAIFKLLIGLVVILALSFFFHESLRQIVYIFLGSSLGVLGFLSFYIYRDSL